MKLRAFDHSLAAQKEEIGVARSSLLPHVSFEERFMRTDIPAYVFSTTINQGRFTSADLAGAPGTFNNPGPINDFQTFLGVEQPVFVRKASIGVAMKKEEYAARQEEFIRKKEEITFKVVQAYLIVDTAKGYAQVAEQAVQDAKEHLRLAQLRYNNKLGLYSDTLRASTALTDAEQKRVSAHKNLQVAKRALGLLLGSSESMDVRPDFPELPVMAMDYYTEASLSRRDLKSLELRYENAKRNIQYAESGYFPVVGVGSSYQLYDHAYPFGADGDGWQLMAFVRWDLFDGTKREYERSKAKYQAAETRENLDGLKNTISYVVYDAYLGVEETRKNVDLSKSALKTAEEGTRLVQVRYENSLSPLVDLLDAQLSLDHARANLIATENRHRAAIANLGYQSGTLLKDLQID